MTKIAQSKHKISRRMGESLWGGKSPLERGRNSRPGQHGARRGKMSDYGNQLQAKQKLKGYYNMQERQFRRFYAEARRRKGDTGQNLINLLERRLDTVIYRLKLAPTIFAARQFVGHGHIMVNGKRCNIPSYIVRDNDEISLTAGAEGAQSQSVLTGQAQTFREVPEYLQLDVSTFKGKFIRSPQLSDVPYPVQMKPNLVVELYSR
ncbi:MAG: 30S ribosomal protein S4 [Alphaproteobacteria bacterium]|nr:MAG: 30S ribosomal protein S4 [Alphaproteobacteria bacterium]